MSRAGMTMIRGILSHPSRPTYFAAGLLRQGAGCAILMLPSTILTPSASPRACFRIDRPRRLMHAVFFDHLSSLVNLQRDNR
jgi:hypothetical protein